MLISGRFDLDLSWSTFSFDIITFFIITGGSPDVAFDDSCEKYKDMLAIPTKIIVSCICTIQSFSKYSFSAF